MTQRLESVVAQTDQINPKYSLTLLKLQRSFITTPITTTALPSSSDFQSWTGISFNKRMVSRNQCHLLTEWLVLRRMANSIISPQVPWFFPCPPFSGQACAFTWNPGHSGMLLVVHGQTSGCVGATVLSCVKLEPETNDFPGCCLYQVYFCDLQIGGKYLTSCPKVKFPKRKWKENKQIRIHK